MKHLITGYLMVGALGLVVFGGMLSFSMIKWHRISTIGKYMVYLGFALAIVGLIVSCDETLFHSITKNFKKR